MHANILIVLCLKVFYVEQFDKHNTEGNWKYLVIGTLVRTLPEAEKTTRKVPHQVFIFLILV